MKWKKIKKCGKNINLGRIGNRVSLSVADGALLEERGFLKLGINGEEHIVNIFWEDYFI